MNVIYDHLIFYNENFNTIKKCILRNKQPQRIFVCND